MTDSDGQRLQRHRHNDNGHRDKIDRNIKNTKFEDRKTNIEPTQWVFLTL
jgi:hypothetical protein